MPEVDGGILFVEDINEHPYRVERMLLQLWHAGVLGVPILHGLPFGHTRDKLTLPVGADCQLRSDAAGFSLRLSGHPVIDGR